MPVEDKGTPMRMKNFFLRLRSYLLSGIVVVAPVAITLYIIWWMMDTIDRMVEAMLPREVDTITFLFTIPGFGFFVALAILILIGALARGVVGTFFIRKGEQVLHKLPVVRSIYAGIKQVFEAFLGSNSMSFREVGLIEYPRRGIWSLCFITGATQGEVQERTSDSVVNVFLPTTPNPTSGFLLFLPKEDIIILDMKVEQGLKMVISAGIVTPPYLPKGVNVGVEPPKK